jgi:serine protease Do
MSASFSRIARLVCAMLVLSAIAAGPALAEHLWVEGAAQGGGVIKAQTLPDFIDLAAKLGPTVVNVSTEAGGNPKGESEEEKEGDPNHELMPYHQFAEPFEPMPRHAQSLGSGFIINKAGYVVTNEHVIEDAKEIRVTVRDGHQYKGRLVGRDPKSDIALIKIDANHEFAAAPLGNSDELRVGEWVMAIGSPFGFDHSVTAGIVSATSRFIPGNYDDFIQTDASINPGNSGGPLINLRGEVIGVNSAIYTRTGASMGIGFAIPVNLLKDELDQLKTRGRITRGWLGVYVQNVTPELSESMGLEDAHGALVADVVKTGPAKIAGIQRGDLVVSYDGKPIGDSQELPLMVGRTPVGSIVKLKVIRKKEIKEVSVTITPSHEEELQKASITEEQTPFANNEDIRLGFTLKDLTADLAREMGTKQNAGVVIAEIRPGSAAEKAGLHTKDIILEVNRHQVKDVSAYEREAQTGGGRSLLLLVQRNDVTMFIPVKPAG